ncbi:MAG: hypothetical protein K2X38_03435 [Gemmataceae bacterium]|nr:hypothetical protein [Gemmataceae bacterium]
MLIAFRVLKIFLVLLIVFHTAVVAHAQGVFVGVGYGGRRIVSRDGKEWKIAAEWAEKGGDDSNNLMSVVYGKGKFVAVGGGGAGATGKGHILVSTDGEAWKEVHTAKFRIHPVLFGEGRFVAGGPGRNFLVSHDGETWKEGAKFTEPKASHFRHGAFGNGRFVFLGNAGGNSPVTWVATTKDGETLEHLAIDLPRVRGLTFADGKFVAVGPDGMRMTSADGKTWKRFDAEEKDEFAWIVRAGDRFVCGGGKKTYQSRDGEKWERWLVRIPCEVKSVTESMWVGTTWPGQMWHSEDGKTWVRAKTAPPNGINEVTFGGK